MVFLTFFAAQLPAAQNGDTLFSRVRLVSPKPFTVITQNSVRLLADVPEGAPRFREIRFYATYKESADSLKSLIRNERVRFFGAVSNPPYELIADLSAIPDQDQGGLTFYLHVADSSGREIAPGSTGPVFYALDRHSGLSDNVFSSVYTRAPPVMDGSLEDWNSADTVSFMNGENRVRAASVWDRSALYFAVTVYDNSITGPYAQRGYLHKNLDAFYYPIDTSSYVPLIRYDEIELFFNIRADRSHSMRTLDDRHLLVGAKGAWYGRAFDHQKGISRMWATTARICVREFMNPSRYNVEAAIPWSEFGHAPHEGLRMSFDLFSKDNMVAGGPCVGVSWNGAEYTHYNNPSEWGEMVLKGGPVKVIPILLVCCVIFALLTGYYLQHGRFKKKEGGGAAAPEIPGQISRNDLIVNAIEAQITANHSDAELNAAKIARAVGINAKYAGSLFKAYKNITISQFLNNLRLEKARELLEKSDKNITEISFEVGYGAPEYFTKVFKIAEGISPSEYRLKVRNRTGP